MNKKITLVENKTLKRHERIQKKHLFKLLGDIREDGMIREPIIVDKNTMIILDGHHRSTAVKYLRLRLIPVYFVDYASEEIRVECWRVGEEITKKQVLHAGKTGKLLRPKTSRHEIPHKPMHINISLEKLR